MSYEIQRLSEAEQQQLQRVYDDLKQLAQSSVPGVASAARAALAQVATALSGEGLAYELYSKDWK
ncbi:MAG: hypothetical protein E6J02_00850 [Chloroflexi bacterium]|nr:MAG: hypothetical protein E6J02_00850 [Chloroflexota bacterium]TME19839.1 MAG: hypothetical protein E6I70_02715 [Chloroflexota bacterium]